MKDFTDKVAFITGGASGIGLGLAEGFGREGMKVMIADIEQKALDGALEKLHAAQITAEGVVCDVASRKSVQAAALATIAKFGKVHICCNNAGVGVGGQIGHVPERDWDWIIDVNLKGVVHGAETFAPLIAQHGEGGHIVNTASLAGMIGAPFLEPYHATKFAVVAMSEGWRIQLAPMGVGVSVLCPGWVKTRIMESPRNKPERYGGPHVVRAQDAPGYELLQAGVDPSMLAARVIEAIKADELYIFTHAEYKPILAQRFNSILSAMDTAAASPALKGHVPDKLG
jgi:NAD(P)-dependent dehydrogenase (short-subunit alcohol dehydrogenase family)